MLILLDGLDEVPTEGMSEMVTMIQNFVDRHSKNRFITSCRIAAYRNNFRRFTDVAIADFDDQQIKNFITNWFVSNPARGNECLARLNSGDFQAAKELTQTPLLLTLVCILYQRSGQFPTNRSTLYERALRVLLEEWNGAKEIPIEQLYKGLDTKRKELILSQIAYDTFIDDQLFFPKRTVVKQIEELLPELLPDEKFVDGNLVLRDIEVQHGLLVERAESIYSFSHLTIQEFLTAQQIDYNNIPIEPLVNQYLCDKRWREIFLLLAGLRKADNLLLAMEQKIHSLMNTPKLQNLLAWVEKVTDSSSGDIQPVGKRAIAIYLAFTLDLAKIKFQPRDIYSDDIIHALACLLNTKSEDIKIKIALENQQLEMTKNQILIKAQNLATTITERLIQHLYYFFIRIKTRTFNAITPYISFTDYIQWSQEFQIYQNVDYSEIIPISEEFNKLEKPTRYNDEEIDLAFMQKLIGTWQQGFHLNLEILELSESEMKAMDNYLYANLLMVECKKVAVRVSPETWKGIESRMLLPIDNTRTK